LQISTNISGIAIFQFASYFVLVVFSYEVVTKVDQAIFVNISYKTQLFGKRLFWDVCCYGFAFTLLVTVASVER